MVAAESDGRSGGHVGDGVKTSFAIVFEAFERIELTFDGVGDWGGEPLGLEGGVRFEGPGEEHNGG
jgi:hypothetical protein